jgi:hypothetical protein
VQIVPRQAWGKVNHRALRHRRMLQDSAIGNVLESFVQQKYATFEEVLTLIESSVQRRPIIGIDGLPCSGKSSMVDRLRHIESDCIYLIDFVFAQRDWPSEIEPSHRFYVRSAH